MRPSKIWANLAVEDVAKTRAFYKTLGFKSNEGDHINQDLTSFMIGDKNFIVHFFAKAKLQEAIGGALADLSKGNEIIFTLWADTREEADRWAQEVREAGGTLFSEPQAYGPGYYGFGFSDPDGHKWNVFNM